MPAIVTRYTITSANDKETRDQELAVIGSNDGVHWDTLDSRAGELFATRFLKKGIYGRITTTFFNGSALNITIILANLGLQLSEWGIVRETNQNISFDGIPDKTFGDDDFPLVANASSDSARIFHQCRALRW